MTLDENEEILPFETLGMGQRSAFEGPVERLVRSEDEWAQVSASMKPFLPFATVDFSQAMLAVIAVPTESGGFTIEVESVEILDGEIEIAYAIGEPGIDCITPTEVSVPFQVVKMRKTEGEVHFIRRNARFSCKDF